MPDSRMEEARAKLRDLALPWGAAQALALQCAVRTVDAMRANLSACAGDDPYEAGAQTTPSPPGTRPAEDPTVQAIATVFTGILNRRGLIRIDPA